MPESPTLPRIAATSLLDIPLELRRQIYHYCLLRPAPIAVNYLWNGPSTSPSPRHEKSLLLVSRQIGEETLDVLYGSNIFRVDLNGFGGEYLQKNLTAVNRLKIRRLLLVIPDQDQYFDSLQVQPKLWSPILARVSNLSIVVKQPLQGDPSRGVLDIKKCLRDWLAWVRPMLDFLSGQLPGEVIVQVDDDGREPIAEMMRECFPGRYREVKTKAGDWIFRRGDDFEEYTSYVRELRRGAEDEDEDVEWEDVS